MFMPVFTLFLVSQRIINKKKGTSESQKNLHKHYAIGTPSSKYKFLVEETCHYARKAH